MPKDKSKPMTTKDRLFIAAVKIFGEKGYDGATVRDICAVAEAANMTAVSYHFGGKRQLYETILTMMFASLADNSPTRLSRKSKDDALPEEQLHTFIHTYYTLVYTGKLSREAAAILLREMVRPSAILAELVRKYTIPDTLMLMEILQGILGPDMPRATVRDCLASLVGQLTYYMTYWPLFSQVFPEHPGVKEYLPELVEHTMRFTMAGLKATRQAFDRGDMHTPFKRQQGGSS